MQKNLFKILKDTHWNPKRITVYKRKACDQSKCLLFLQTDKYQKATVKQKALGFRSGAVEVSVLLASGVASQGDWCPTIGDHEVISSSSFEKSTCSFQTKQLATQGHSSRYCHWMQDVRMHSEVPVTGQLDFFRSSLRSWSKCLVGAQIPPCLVRFCQCWHQNSTAIQALANQLFDFSPLLFIHNSLSHYPTFLVSQLPVRSLTYIIIRTQGHCLGTFKQFP
jgi:hypothetical protein